MNIPFHPKSHKALLLILVFFALLVGGCVGQTSLPPSLTPTTPQAGQASYQLSLEKSIGQGIAQAVDWASDGRSFAIGTSLQVDLYDSSSNEVTATLETGQSNLVVKYSPDSLLLAVAADDGSVQVWDVSQKRRMYTFTGAGQYKGYGPSPVLSFSSDGKKLAVANDQTITILDVSTGKTLDTFPGHGDSLTAVAFNTQGNVLLAAGGGRVFVRNLATRELLYPSVGLKDSIEGVFFGEDDASFITVSTSSKFNDVTSDLDFTSHLRIWDSATGKLQNEYEATNYNLYGVAANLAKGEIALGGQDRIAIWDMSAKRVTKTLLLQRGWINSLAISPDGSKLISINNRGEGLAQVWDLPTRKVIMAFDRYSAMLSQAVFSSAGGLVASVGAGRLVEVRDANTGKRRYSLAGNAPLAFSPDGKILAYAQGVESAIPMTENSYNRQLALVDAGTGKALPGDLPCPGASALAFSPDGKMVVYGGANYDGNCDLQIHDVTSGKLTLDFAKVEGNERLSFDSLAFSPNGKFLALGGYTVTLLDAKTGQKLREITDLGKAEVVFSPDSRYLVIDGVGGFSSDGKKVQVLDVATGQVMFVLTTSQSTINKMAFSPDGQLLAIAGHSMELWDAWTGQPLSRQEKVASDTIVGLGFNPDGDGLLTVKDNSAVQHWKIDRGPRAVSLARPTPTSIPTVTPTQAADVIEINTVAELGKGVSSRVTYSPNGKIAAFIDGGNLVWFDASTLAQLGKVEAGDEYSRLTFSPNGKIVVVDAGMGAQIVDLQGGKVLGSVNGGNGSSFGYTFSKDSQYMAYVVGDRSTGGPYQYISVWSVAAGKQLGGDPDYQSQGEEFFPTLLENRYHVMSPPAISPDGKLVAAGHNDKRVYVWDLHTGKTVFTLEGHAGRVTAVAFSPNGSLLASGSSDGTVRLWYPATGKLARVLTGFLDDVSGVSFSADGKLLTVSVAEKPDQVVDLQSGKISEVPTAQSTPDPFELRQFKQGYSTGNGTIFSAVSFSPDGRALALASENVFVWDVATQKLLTFLENSQGGVIRGIAFDPGGKRLAVTTDCGNVIAWDLQTGTQVFSQTGAFLTGMTVLYGAGDTELGPARGGSAVAEQGLAFSPDGQSLAFGNDNAIEIWNVGQNAKVATFANPEGLYATQVSFSADGKHLYAIINRDRAAQVWDIASGTLLKKVDLPHVDPNAYSASALNGPFFARNNTQTDQGSWIELWNLETGNLLKLAMPSADNEPLRFSPDGSLLLALNGKQVYFWKTSTGQLVYRWTVENLWQSGLALSPDNLRLATNGGGKAQLWDVSQVSRLAQRSDIPDLGPHPSATPLIFAWPSATPQPTVTARPAGSGAGVASVISSSNAVQLKERSRFGQGTVAQAAWSPAGDSILVAGSLGTFKYSLQPDGSLSETSRLEKAGWSYGAVSLPDGRVLSTGERDGHVYVWEMATGATLADLEGHGATALSPDGNLLAYFDSDQKLQIWDISQKKAATTLLSYYSGVDSPIFSPDGEWVAAITGRGSRYSDSVRVWDVSTGVIVNALGGPDNDITDLSFSRDGRFMTGAAGGSAWVWDVVHPAAPPEQIQLYQVEINGNLNIYPQTVTAAALSPDDALAAVGTSENQLTLYQREPRRKLRDLTGVSSPIRRLSFSPDGKTLLSVDEDGLIALWDVETGKQLTSLDKHLGAIGGLVFRQDGALSVWGAGTDWVIQPKDGKLTQTTRISKGKILAASPAGDFLAVYNPFQVSLWDVRAGKFGQTLEGEATTPFVEYFWEGLAFRQFYAAAFSADGSRLATVGAGGAWAYSMSDKRLIQQFEGSNAQRLALSADGNILLTSLYDQMNPLSAYDLQTGNTLFSLGNEGSRGGGSNIPQAAFSPDGRWAGALQTNWDDGPTYELVLYDRVLNQPGKTFELGKKVSGLSLAFHPTSPLVAVGMADGNILLIDLDGMRVIATLAAHSGPVTHLAFSSDGLYLASGSADGTARIWGVP
ncbi:MAG: hypothetical protein WA821_02885 [Anaerolineales bacterium]